MLKSSLLINQGYMGNMHIRFIHIVYTIYIYIYIYTQYKYKLYKIHASSVDILKHKNEKLLFNLWYIFIFEISNNNEIVIFIFVFNTVRILLNIASETLDKLLELNTFLDQNTYVIIHNIVQRPKLKSLSHGSNKVGST